MTEVEEARSGIMGACVHLAHCIGCKPKRLQGAREPMSGGSAEGGRRRGKQEVYSHIRAAKSVRRGKRPGLPGPSDSSEIQENLQPCRKAGSALLDQEIHCFKLVSFSVWMLLGIDLGPVNVGQMLYH